MEEKVELESDNENLKEDAKTYADYLSFLMSEFGAEAIVLTVLGGNHGSASLVGVRNAEAMHHIPKILEELVVRVKRDIIKRSCN